MHSNDNIPADQTKALKAKFGNQVRLAPYLGTFYLAVNTSKKPFDDVRVRRALSMAIDREFIADQIWGNTMVPATRSCRRASATTASRPTPTTRPRRRSIARTKAKALLKEAGFGPGKPLKLQIRFNTNDNNRATVVAVADQWKQIGVESTFINTDAKTHFAHLRDGGDFDVARAGWIGDYSDPQNFLFLVESDNSGFNYAKYKNPEYDALMKKAAAEVNLEARATHLLAAEKILMRDLPYIPLLYYGSKNLVSSKTRGLARQPARCARDAVLEFEAVSNLAVPGEAVTIGVIPRAAQRLRGALQTRDLVGGLERRSRVCDASTAGSSLHRARDDTRMTSYILRRLASAIPTLFLIVTIAFFLIRLAPGGPFDLEQPLEAQGDGEPAPHLQARPAAATSNTGSISRRCSRGDFGPSFYFRDFTVAELFAQGAAGVDPARACRRCALAVLVGGALGAIAALRQNSAVDYAVIGLVDPRHDDPDVRRRAAAADRVRAVARLAAGRRAGTTGRCATPSCRCIVLALPQIAVIARLTRAAMIETLRANHIRTLRAQGLRHGDDRRRMRCAVRRCRSCPISGRRPRHC